MLYALYYTFCQYDSQEVVEASLFGEGGLDTSSYLIIYLSLTSAKGMTRTRTVQPGMAAGTPFSLCEHLGKAAAATQTLVSPWELGQRPQGDHEDCVSFPT